jgi:hypothetical protein
MGKGLLKKCGDRSPGRIIIIFPVISGTLPIGAISRDVQDLSMDREYALGAKGFAKTTQEKLGIKGKGQEILGGNGSYQLREAQTANNGYFDLGNGHLRS